MAAPKKKIVKKEVKDAILRSSTSITAIAKICGCDYKVMRKYIDQHPDLLELLESHRKQMVKQAEDIIYKDIENGNVKTAKWLLKVKGGDEWSETNKIEHSGDVGINIIIKDSPDEIND